MLTGFQNDTAKQLTITCDIPGDATELLHECSVAIRLRSILIRNDTNDSSSPNTDVDLAQLSWIRPAAVTVNQVSVDITCTENMYYQRHLRNILFTSLHNKSIDNIQC